MLVTVSPKFQVVIPKEVRETLALKKGHKVSVVAKGGVAFIIPQKPLSRTRGLLKGFRHTSRLRDKGDRAL